MKTTGKIEVVQSTCAVFALGVSWPSTLGEKCLWLWDIEQRQSGHLQKRREFGSREILCKCLYFDFERVHLYRKLRIWAIYPIIIVIIGTAIY